MKPIISLKLGKASIKLRFDHLLWWENQPEIGERRYVILDASFINGKEAALLSFIFLPFNLVIGWPKT